MYDCIYQGTLSCGQTELKDSGIVGNADATHVIETLIGSTTKIEPNGSATVEVSVFLNDRPMSQEYDYSFSKMRPQPNHQFITLHRQGWLIWGTLPE